MVGSFMGDGIFYNMSVKKWNFKIYGYIYYLNLKKKNFCKNMIIKWFYFFFEVDFYERFMNMLFVWGRLKL